MVVHNTNEGDIFIPDSFSTLFDAASYTAQLFPKLENSGDVKEVYSDAGDNLGQLQKIFAEGEREREKETSLSWSLMRLDTWQLSLFAQDIRFYVHLKVELIR